MLSRTCAHCGDVVGVYEPLVLVIDGEARATSWAAESRTDACAGVWYHEACHAARLREDTPVLSD